MEHKLPVCQAGSSGINRSPCPAIPCKVLLSKLTHPPCHTQRDVIWDGIAEQGGHDLPEEPALEKQLVIEQPPTLHITSQMWCNICLEGSHLSRGYHTKGEKTHTAALIGALSQQRIAHLPIRLEPVRRILHQWEKPCTLVLVGAFPLQHITYLPRRLAPLRWQGHSHYSEMQHLHHTPNRTHPHPTQCAVGVRCGERCGPLPPR
eukprot:1133809-Pelagomonas_calceolata.AAC.3